MTITKEIISTEKAPKAIGPYSQGIKLGELVFISGQLPLNPETGELAEDVEAQAHQSLKNISEILVAAGTNLSKVVKATIFVKDLNNFKIINEVYASYFTENPPARSTVEVARLPLDADIEIEVIATL